MLSTSHACVDEGGYAVHMLDNGVSVLSTSHAFVDEGGYAVHMLDNGVSVLSTSHACVGEGEGRGKCMLDDCCMVGMVMACVVSHQCVSAGQQEGCTAATVH